MKCDLCGHSDESATTLLDDALLIDDHFRLFHPDIWAQSERWPDGSIVIEDTTIEPGDFE